MKKIREEGLEGLENEAKRVSGARKLELRGAPGETKSSPGKPKGSLRAEKIIEGMAGLLIFVVRGCPKYLRY